MSLASDNARIVAAKLLEHWSQSSAGDWENIKKTFVYTKASWWAQKAFTLLTFKLKKGSINSCINNTSCNNFWNFYPQTKSAENLQIFCTIFCTNAPAFIDMTCHIVQTNLYVFICAVSYIFGKWPITCSNIYIKYTYVVYVHNYYI